MHQQYACASHNNKTMLFIRVRSTMMQLIFRFFATPKTVFLLLSGKYTRVDRRETWHYNKQNDREYNDCDGGPITRMEKKKKKGNELTKL